MKKGKSVHFDDTEWQKLEMNHNIMVDDPNEIETVEYRPGLAGMIATLMRDVNSSASRKGLKFAKCFGQQYILEQGMKKFGDRRKKAAKKELDQLHR